MFRASVSGVASDVAAPVINAPANSQRPTNKGTPITAHNKRPSNLPGHSILIKGQAKVPSAIILCRQAAFAIGEQKSLRVDRLQHFQESRQS